MNGVFLGRRAANNTVQGNYIGTDATGSFALGNAGDGVYVEADAGNGNTVGGTAAEVGNVISGNGQYGIELDVPVTEDFNVIGLNAALNDFLRNGSGGSENGNFGPDDIHQ